MITQADVIAPRCEQPSTAPDTAITSRAGHLGGDVRGALFNRYNAVRGLTLRLADVLSDADATAQSMPDASPAKWHLAHTSWFFETFVLRDHVRGYAPFDERWPFLFNSYYEAEGARLPRPSRGLLTRPSLEEVLLYRAHVDQALASAWSQLSPAALDLVALGCHHEEQHQELFLTDILHLFAQNPLSPCLFAASPKSSGATPAPAQWIDGRTGPTEIGHTGDGFGFDCEGPRHTVWLAPHALADRVVTNGEWRDFVEDGGYATASLWLSDGWAFIKERSIEAPLYWRHDADGCWTQSFGLDGLATLDMAAPVSHISYYEADAFAHWSGARLPTEAEWESAAVHLNPDDGTLLESAMAVHPLPARSQGGMRQMFGDVWEWTASAYLPYPGFRTAPGAVGEYNGKFMSGQFVLRGGSCATPRGHVRSTYRNFFYPHQRWQFTGLRLAKDL